LRPVDFAFMSFSRFIHRDLRGGEPVTLWCGDASSHSWAWWRKWRELDTRPWVAGGRRTGDCDEWRF
jgi:hypothetical protein